MNEKGKIILVSGEIESGKTRFCAKSATILKEKGWDTAGLLSPAVFKGGRKTAIDALDMRRGARRRLAELKETDTAGDRIQTKRWRFSPTVLEWCNQVLAAAVPCDLLVVDELGPLEFERNQGLLNGFRVVDSGMYRVSLTVVRPSLLSKARERWPGAEVVLLDMNPDISKIIEEFVQST